MEEGHRLRNDVPFGWLAALLAILRRHGRLTPRGANIRMKTGASRLTAPA